MTASLLKYPGLFSVFWPFSTMWMVSTRPATSKSFCAFNNPLVTVRKALITIGIIARSTDFSIPLQGRSTYPSFHILSVLFCGQPGSAKSTILKILFFFFVDLVWSVDKIWSSDRD